MPFCVYIIISRRKLDSSFSCRLGLAMSFPSASRTSLPSNSTRYSCSVMGISTPICCASRYATWQQ